jgi:hypothetical protein
MYILLFTIVCLGLAMFFAYHAYESEKGSNSILKYGILSAVSFVGVIVLISMGAAGNA